MKLLLSSIIGFLVLFVAVNSYSFTTNELEIVENNLGLHLNSFPDKFRDVPEPNFEHALLCYTRENGIWGNPPIAVGKTVCEFTEKKWKQIDSNIKALQAAIDKILKPHVLISFSYIVCYQDVVIYINDNHMPKELHKIYYNAICSCLNIERNKAIGRK